MAIISSEIIADAARSLSDLGADSGGAFTCGEADAVARMLRHLGHQEEAKNFLYGHALEDVEDDRHLVGEGEDSRPMNEREIEQYMSERWSED